VKAVNLEVVHARRTPHWLWRPAADAAEPCRAKHPKLKDRDFAIWQGQISMVDLREIRVPRATALMSACPACQGVDAAGRRRRPAARSSNTGRRR
jgi:hypothetical protein